MKFVFFIMKIPFNPLGTVALCAGCNIYPTWAAFVVGAIAGPLFLLSDWLLLKLKVSTYVIKNMAFRNSHLSLKKPLQFAD